MPTAYDGFRTLELDIRDADGIDRLFAAPSRATWSSSSTPPRSRRTTGRPATPHTDFSVNATGTLNLLEAARTHEPDATFIFTSTNKVYGDRPNDLPLVEEETRLELPDGPP